MKWFPKYRRDGLAAPRRCVPRLEPLEGRQVLTVIAASAAFNSLGLETIDVVYSNGALFQYQYDVSNGARVQLSAYHVIDNVRSVSVNYAESLAGQFVPNVLVTDIVFTSGALWQFNSAGSAYHVIDNVRSASTTFDTSGKPVTDIVFVSGALWQVDSAGAHQVLTNGVQSVGVTPFEWDSVHGFPVIDVVLTDGSLWQRDTLQGWHNLVPNSVQYASVTQDPLYNSGFVYDVVFTNGSLHQYQDQDGQLLDLILFQ